MDQTSPDPVFERVSHALGRQRAARWRDLSERTREAAVRGEPTSILRQLEEAGRGDADSPLAPAFRLWRADTLARIGRDRDAVAAYDDARASAASAPTFERVDFVREALRHRAGALARLGDIDAAVASHRELAEHGEDDALYLAGVLAERAGRFDEATSLYREVAEQERTPDADDPRQCALRAAQRLDTADGVFTPSPLGIAQLVESALTAGDAGALRRLASPTHLKEGPGGGHFRFETDDVLERLAADLAESRPRRLHEGLLGTGGKRYLLTSGWRGQWFRHVVGFYFAQSGRGWQWEGVVVNAPAEAWFERWAPRELRTNQPLPFPLLAPWPEGRHFMAGGLELFATQSASILVALAVPIFGPAIAAGLAFTYSLSDCGYGLRGFHYNQGPTHSGNDAFAIDFTAYRRGLPFDNVAGGTPVLAAAPGVIRFTRTNIASGDSSAPNEVQIDHDDPATGTPRFVSRYLHMAGPGLIPVSAGMIAPTGARLGVMNDR
jgi:hypothetical protein